MKPGAALVMMTFATVIVVQACKVPSDLGTHCTLRKAPPADAGAGAAPPPILEGDVQTAIAAGDDIVSFGDTDCQDYFVCVHDSQMPFKGDGGTVEGYCSKPCSTASASTCTVTDTAGQTDKRGFLCRSLLLDEATIAAICQADPQKCETTFGSNRSSTFCAKGDGGL